MIDLDALRKAAEAATPGPWRTTLVDDTRIETDCHSPVACTASETDYEDNYHEYYKRDATYIAAADPTTVLSLIAENKIMRSAVISEVKDDRGDIAKVCLECGGYDDETGAETHSPEYILYNTTSTQDPNATLNSMILGLHAMLFGESSQQDPEHALASISDGGEIHEFVHEMVRLLPHNSKKLRG